MLIEGHEAQSVLHHACRDPDVVRGDGRTRCAERVHDDGVSVGCFFIEVGDADPRRGQEQIQLPLVLLPVLPPQKPSLQLPEDDGVDEDFVGLLD